MSDRPPITAYVEAALALVTARIKVRLEPSRSHFMTATTGKPAQAEEIAMICRTINAASRRLPIRTECYERALAARTMLARRGRSSQLHLGGAREDGRLAAHVWLTSGEKMVIGADEATQYRRLASSPDA